MIRLVVLVLSLTLSGCFYQSTSSWDIDRAVHFCADKSGVASVSVHYIGLETVLCRNGEGTNLTEVQL